MLCTDRFPSFSRASSSGSPAPDQKAFNTVGNEMTSQLTSTESHIRKDTMSSFQSAKDRHDRLSRPGANGGGMSNAGLTNWRRNTSVGDVKFGGQPILSPQKSDSDLGHEEKTVPVSSVSPGPVWPSQNQLKAGYAYAIRRADGQFTQLIRADELETLDLSTIPATQGPEGLIALPPPEFERPERRHGKVFITGKEDDSLPKNRVSRPQPDPIQRVIDTICATSPATIVSPVGNKTPRRQKIYCDKWIHEGVCAFTQLGCKYKHEMPLDKATQLSLGLNHGLPSWYKRAHAVQIRPELQGSPPAPRVAGPWRRSDGSSGLSTGLSLGTGLSSSPPGPPAYSQPSFGPISRPPPTYQQPSMSSNSFTTLAQDDTKMEDEEDDDEIMWTGRRR